MSNLEEKENKDVPKLKRERTALQSAFTRTENRIRHYLQKKGSSFEEVDEALFSLCSTHERLVQKVSEIKCKIQDSEECEHLDSYMNDLTEKINLLKTDIEFWRCDQVLAKDSASQTSSRLSNKSSSSKVAAKKAALIVKSEALKEKQELKMKQLQLEMQEEALNLKIEIAAAEAEERVLKENENKAHNIQTTQETTPKTRQNSTLSQVLQPNTGLNPHSPEWIPKTQDSMNLQIEMLQLMQLPKTEIQSFDGNPLSYWNFMRSFDNNVGNSSISNSAKLNRLLQYCTGRALEVINCCVVMDSELGYDRARRLLHERFGNEYVISKSWIDKVTEGPALRGSDCTEMRKYADAVRSCVVSLTAMGRLSEIDNQLRMKRIVDKLPVHVQGRWRKTAVGYMKECGHYPGIESLARFIETVADELDDPVFGVGTSSEREPRRRTPVNGSGFRRTATNFNIQEGMGPQQDKSVRWDNGVQQRDSLCRFCSGHHPLYRCNSLRQLTLQKRLDFVIKHRLCFNCLSGNHMSFSCNKASMCGIGGCVRMHSSLLHDFTRSNNGKGKIKKSSAMSTQTDESMYTHKSVCGMHGAGGLSGRIALPIVPVYVRSSKGDIKTHALLDPGSTNTFCSKDLAEHLDDDGSSILLSVNTLTDSIQTKTKMTSLTIFDTSGQHSLKMSNVFILAEMPSLKDSYVTQKDIDKWEHFEGITLPDIDGKVSLLIGQDNPLALAPIDVRFGGPNEPYATKTIFGWAINGPLREGAQQKIVSNFVQADSSLQAQVERFWELDHEVDEKLQMSPQDKKVVELWDRTLKKKNGHYHLPIPFKEDPPNLKNNYCVAESRLESLGKKLSKNDDMFSSYKAGIQDLLDKGYAEKVPDLENQGSEGLTWYLPHHSVTSEKKPGKFRIVFDCSAKYHRESLNTQVLQGPDLTNSLLGVLMRFRQEKIAITSDIEAMFHQVKVAEEHRDALRFLWWNNDDIYGKPEIYRMTSHLFGGIWSPSCANYALRRTALDNQDDFDQEVVETVSNNFYVDDCLKSVPTEDKAIHLVQDLGQLLQRGGFKLTKWLSNSREVIESIPVQERAKNLKDLDLSCNQLPEDKALGVRWYTNSDELVFKFTPKDKPLTRRGVISVLSSLYDPLGFLSPVVLQAKMIFQDECRLKKDWDSTLASENAVKWQSWLDNLPAIESFSMPRCIVPDNFGKVMSYSLHHFGDASTRGYGAVSYLRLVNTSGRVHVSFLAGKSRLAPIKSITIPRLELSAAVLSVKLDNMITSELTLLIQDSTFWSDSMIVLHYIKNSSQRYQTFVANRVFQICNSSSPENWRHVPSALNPADDASRGVDADKISSRDTWMHGPDFLWQSEEYWPQVPEVFDIPSENLELKKTSVNLTDTKCKDNCTSNLMNRYSSWHKFRRIVSWILRLKECLLKRAKGDKSAVISMEPLELQELKQAEKTVIKQIQLQEFPSEIDMLHQGKAVNGSSPIQTLDPFLNSEGILCVGGRLKNAPIPESNKHQAILPKQHHIVNLIVRATHEELGHSGTEHVLSVIREKYWIIRGRQAVKKVLTKCVMCRRNAAKFSSQKMADLPADRVTPNLPPFSHIGVDCFGPFYVKQGRSQVKRYGCLFTCLCTRAIHIEKLDNMDTDSFINGLRRFIARRGKPTLVRSDNGTNFKGAQRELKLAINSWNKVQIQDFMQQKNIHWIFNPPAASHMGGVWERQIRTVRKVLNAMLCEQSLRDEGLDTLFCEVESIVNSRPITVVSDSPKDMEALTPNHILLLRGSQSVPPGEFTVHDVYRKRWKHIQFLADQFWRRWTREYLPSLQARQKWMKPEVNISVGDIVLLMDEQSPRFSWPLGRIIKTFPGNDGLIRCVEVKTQSSILNRPIHKLCLLESVN